MSPRAFSFNSPHGACPACQGLGATWDFDPQRVVPDETQVARRRRDRAVGQGRQADGARGGPGDRLVLRHRSDGAVRQAAAEAARSAAVRSRRGGQGARPGGRQAGRRPRRARRKPPGRRRPRAIRSAATSKASFPTCAGASRKARGPCRKSSIRIARCASARSATATRLRPESLVGQGQGQDDRRLREPADRRRRWRAFDEIALNERESAHRDAHPQGDSGSPAVPQRRRRRLSHARRARRRRCRAAKGSASGWPRRSART